MTDDLKHIYYLCIISLVRKKNGLNWCRSFKVKFVWAEIYWLLKYSVSKIENWWLSVISPTRNNECWIHWRIYASREARSVRDTLYCQPGDRFHPAPLKLQGVLIARRSRSSIVSDDCRQSARQLERRSRCWSDKSDVTSRQQNRIHEDVIVSLNIARFADDPRRVRFEMSIRWQLLRLKVCLHDTIF